MIKCIRYLNNLSLYSVHMVQRILCSQIYTYTHTLPGSCSDAWMSWETVWMYRCHWMLIIKFYPKIVCPLQLNVHHSGHVFMPIKQFIGGCFVGAFTHKLWTFSSILSCNDNMAKEINWVRKRTACKLNKSFLFDVLFFIFNNNK